MISMDNKKPITGGEQKIEEYVNRIKAGESKDSIFKDLPESFRTGIEKRLSEPSEQIPVEDKTEDIDQAKDIEESLEVPSKFRGLDSESLDYMWTFPEYLDEKKNEELRSKKKRVIALLKEKELAEALKKEKHEASINRVRELNQQLGIVQPSMANEEVTKQKENPIQESPTLSLEERKRLRGWPASYELAKIAKQKGIDLSKISREEYVEFAIENSLAIDDDQLRIAPWQRMGTSVEEIVLVNREKKKEINEEAEKAFAKFSFEMRQKAEEENRSLLENIRVRQGTKNSNSWLFFGINKGIDGESDETFKSYISLKDLNKLTPEKFNKFMVALRDAKYNGDIKIFQDLSEQGVRLNDQIVMHGRSEADAALAVQVAEQFFGSELDQKSLGKDEVLDGKNKSYSQILAKRILDSINRVDNKKK